MPYKSEKALLLPHCYTNDVKSKQHLHFPKLYPKSCKKWIRQWPLKLLPIQTWIEIKLAAAGITEIGKKYALSQWQHNGSNPSDVIKELVHGFNFMKPFETSALCIPFQTSKLFTVMLLQHNYKERQEKTTMREGTHKTHQVQVNAENNPDM